MANIRKEETWKKEILPQWIEPFVGAKGLNGLLHSENTGELATACAGVDRWMANHFIVYMPETRKFLYSEYSETEIHYKKGLLPAFENLALKHFSNYKTDRDKVVGIVELLPEITRHPTVPPCGEWVPANRAHSDEQLLVEIDMWCNEQARVFIRLCQVCNIPARAIFLFYSDHKTGHTIAEAFINGKWVMVDTSWFLLFADANGQLLTAEECHDSGVNQKLATDIYSKRFHEVLNLSDIYWGPNSSKNKEEHKERNTWVGHHLWKFGVCNYPLPE